MDRTENKRAMFQSSFPASQGQASAAMEDELEIDLISLLYHLLERAKWILGISLAITVIMGVITAFVITPKYTATSKLYVLSADDAAINLSDFQIGTYLTADYQEVFNNWHVHERVIEKLALPYNYAEMDDMLEISNPTGTRILYIEVTSSNPQEAKLIADTYASVAQEFIASTMDTKEPNLFEEALLPSAPSSPSLFRNIMLAFLVSLVLCCGVFTMELMFDDKIHSSEDLENYFGIPTLGLLPLQDNQMVSTSKKAFHSKEESA